MALQTDGRRIRIEDFRYIRFSINHMYHLIRVVVFVIICLSLATSCSKKNDSPAPVVLPDMLTAGWTKITSLPKTDFRDIFFPDNLTGYAAGGQGIYKSSDGGINWTNINTVNYEVNIVAANSNRVCFVGNGPRPYISQDGGNSFDSTSYTTAGGGTPGFNDCFFSSLNTCYFSSFQYIWKSVDGGATIDTIFNFGVSSSSTSLFFLNDQQGWIMRNEGIYKTVDAGANWALTTSLNTTFGSICFTDQDNGYYIANGAIYKSIDGGTTWQSVFVPALGDFGDIDFVSMTEGFFCMGNRIFKTTDAGASWTQVAALGNEQFVEIHFNDATHGWACTTDGVVLKFN